MWFLHPCYLPPTVCYLGTYSHIPTCSLAPCAVHPPTIHPSVYLPTHPFTCLLTTPSPPTSQHPPTHPSIYSFTHPAIHHAPSIHPLAHYDFSTISSSTRQSIFPPPLHLCTTALSPSLHLSPSHPPTHPYMFGGHLLCTRHCAADHRSEAEAPLNVSGCSILPASPRAAPPALDASVIPGPPLPGYTHPHWCRAAALTAPLPSRRRSSGA